MKIYLAHPISGMTSDAILDYYGNIVKRLENMYECFYPMIGKGYFRNDPKYKGEPLATNGFTNPVSTNHAIVERDLWMVNQADIVFVDFSKADRVSIGCCMELAWASLLRKHTIVVLDDKDIHKHAFILDCSDIIFPTVEDAMIYLKKLHYRDGS